MKKIIFFVALILLSGYYFFGKGIKLSLMTHGYQSVLLTNGQVFFGKLSVSGSWLKLSDVYYLQAADSLQTTTTRTGEDSNLQLIKRGNELYGPEDAMYIRKDTVLYFENMKDDSKVVEAITKEKSQ